MTAQSVLDLPVQNRTMFACNRLPVCWLIVAALIWSGSGLLFAEVSYSSRTPDNPLAIPLQLTSRKAARHAAHESLLRKYDLRSLYETDARSAWTLATTNRD